MARLQDTADRLLRAFAFWKQEKQEPKLIFAYGFSKCSGHLPRHGHGHRHLLGRKLLLVIWLMRHGHLNGDIADKEKFKL